MMPPHVGNLYHGAIVTSFIEAGADIIMNIDADNQYDPAEMPALIKPIIEGEADVVLGLGAK